MDGSIPGPQVAASQARGMPACFLGSAQRDEGVAAGAWRGEYQLVYLTPELATRSLQRIKSLNETAVRGGPSTYISTRQPRPSHIRSHEIFWTG